MNINDYYLVLKADLQRVRTRILVEIRDTVDPGLTVRWVSATEACYALDREGVPQRWEPFPFRPIGFSSQLGSLSGSAELAIANEGNALTSALDDGSLVNRKVILSMAWLDPDSFGSAAVSRVILLSCEIDSVGLAAGLVTMRLRSGNAGEKSFPYRRLHPVCQWEYGGPGCGPHSNLLLVCNKTQSVTGGCADPNTMDPPTAGGKLLAGNNGGFYVNAANL